MSLRVFKPTTPAQRFKSGLNFEEITKTRPEKSLTRSLAKTSGRSFGKVTQRGIGGGHKQNFRLIDFKRNKRGIIASVASIEYDPNRTANIALLHYEDGEKRYILAPQDLKVGSKVVADEKTEIKAGNAMPLGKMPIGTVIHNVELIPGAGGSIVRSAGTGAIIAAREGNYVHLKLPSKEIRKVHVSCYATIGQIGNIDWKNISLGKAGRSRHLGRRPKVRGVAMDPASHPHGGGEGKSGTGMNPKTRTGKSAFGKTRSRKKPSSKFILSRRKK
ncbi:MAG: 50S ribosomal protein L2 [Candidatus Curtissbacteria bacterium GW2011_GWA1_40_16]|uniref:Large ribosomal subunit protein uL2 n=1 Tax=Candidatus Curtissbacteria bacterium GW2011_GWA1_40_16 TaxID=1618405 RepID=A0A0G0UEY4_9BACT|nr:MAG: 50S ribosomal protein L2 [Candidatus Curtissbacteria bacterium GW2011_GWA1_40_16]